MCYYVIVVRREVVTEEVAAFSICIKPGGIMNRCCPYCHKIVPYNHECDMKPQRKWTRYDGKIARFHHSREWANKSVEIRRRDSGIDQAAINGLDGDPYVETNNLSVHHIVALKDDWNKRLDNYNLITLSARTHELAEKGLIDINKLLEIAKQNEDRSRGIM